MDVKIGLGEGKTAVGGGIEMAVRVDVTIGLGRGMETCL